MERKNGTHCNIEKILEFFYNKYTGCKDCKIKRRLKQYYEIKINYQISEKPIMKRIEINYRKHKKKIFKLQRNT